MNIAITLLALLAWAALYVPVEGWTINEMTYVNNLGTIHTITASITYDFPGHPEFINRQIAPGHFDSDVYTGLGCQTRQFKNPYPIIVKLQINGASAYAIVNTCCDCSLVLLDSDCCQGGGLDVYASRYGDINQPVGNVILTLSPG